MRIAIAAQNDFVSPRLDQTPRLVVFESQGATLDGHETIDITNWPAHGRASRCAQLGIGMVVCGGVSRFDEADFDATAIRLIDGVSGPVNAVIDAILQGTIAVGQSYWARELGEASR